MPVDEEIYRLLFEEYRAVTGQPPPPVRERWLGSYASAANQVALIERPAPSVRWVSVPSGIGASTGFAIGEDLIEELFA